jgi:CBS domain-containing protein
MNEFGAIVDCTLKECKIGFYRPAEELGISVDKFAFDAFVALIERRSSAIPVIGSKSKVCGAIGVRDVRRVTGRQTARELAKTLTQFIEDQSLDASSERNHGIITCFAAESIRTVIGKMRQNKMHCCFIIDQHDDELKGIVTLVEVFKFLLHR